MGGNESFAFVPADIHETPSSGKICIFRPAREPLEDKTRRGVMYFTVRSVLSETEALGDIGDFCGREMSGYR